MAAAATRRLAAPLERAFACTSSTRPNSTVSSRPKSFAHCSASRVGVVAPVEHRRRRRASSIARSSVVLADGDEDQRAKARFELRDELQHVAGRRGGAAT